MLLICKCYPQTLSFLVLLFVALSVTYNNNLGWFLLDTSKSTSLVFWWSIQSNFTVLNSTRGLNLRPLRLTIARSCNLKRLHLAAGIVAPPLSCIGLLVCSDGVGRDCWRWRWASQALLKRSPCLPQHPAEWTVSDRLGTRSQQVRSLSSVAAQAAPR